ncbi:MAG: hypothetical protein FWE37_09040 [Spirochaetaceae bacterium]|nr:hypothetical protein [Spirochaetaceae bacterium]
MLHCRYSIIKVDGQSTIIVEVQRAVFTTMQKKVAVTNFFRSFLKGVAIVLLCYDGQAQPLFYGQQNIIAKLKLINLATINWHNIIIN